MDQSTTATHSGSICAFYAITQPELIDTIESHIRVEWHWDRDDSIDPRSSHRNELMLGGCHCIIQMQVAQQEAVSVANEFESDDLKESVESELPPRKKLKGESSTAPISTNSDVNHSESSSSHDPQIASSRVRYLDQESYETIWSQFLTPTCLSRATILIPLSARFHRLFYSYYQLFIVQQQSTHIWRTDGCPVWLYQFKLNLFNQRLKVMKGLNQEEVKSSSGCSITNCVPVPYSTPFAPALEWSLLRSWRAMPFDFSLDEVPDTFPLFLANYSNERTSSFDSTTTSSSASSSDSTHQPWIGDLLVMPLRTIHAVLDASPDASVVRLKYFLGFYHQLPTPADQSGFSVSHGPNRPQARQFELKNAFDDESSEERKLLQSDWQQSRFDEEAVRLWFGSNEATKRMAIEDKKQMCELPVGVKVPLSDKSPEEKMIQSRQCIQLLSDLNEFGCSLIRGVFPPNLHTPGRTLSYLHHLMRLPSHFSLTSTAPFHALAFHDASRRHEFGLQSHHLRRDPADHQTTHIQASHGNTAYGALCASAVEASLFLQPLIHTIWYDWKLGRKELKETTTTETNLSTPEPSPSISSSTSLEPVRLYTIEVGYQAPLPVVNQLNQPDATIPPLAPSKKRKSKHRP